MRVMGKTACHHTGAETTENVMSLVTLLQNVCVAKVLNKL